MSSSFNLLQSEKDRYMDDFLPESKPPMIPVVARAASGMSSLRYKGMNSLDEASISG